MAGLLAGVTVLKIYDYFKCKERCEYKVKGEVK